MIPLPISDENPASRKPVVTMALIALNAVAWLFELAHGVDLATIEYGLIPRWILTGATSGVLQPPGFEAISAQQPLPWPATILTSMFMHGSWMHIIGNMWFLWIFGDNVEDAMGRGKFVVFYFACGIAAALAQIASGPSSLAPMVGASG
ncbi:MAG TPA: rhomboid family intramembrane serine protease, partial [Polyangia bacterium]|nr:rhomboid family intramembrane serine protease [Polyangia bacterium]